MIYRRFGRTEIRMPVITCGGMRFQQGFSDIEPEKIDRAGQENLERTIHRALELGINHIETARGYGSSEMQLGWVLPKLPREELIVQTKIAPTQDPKEFGETFEKSMRLLQLDRVDLLSFHGINTPEVLDLVLRPGGCLEVGRELQRSGRVGHLGFSTHGSPQLIVDAIRSDAFDYVNLHWYFVNHLNWPAVDEAARHDLGVFIISPNDKGGKLYAPPEKLRRLCEPLAPMVFNDLYCLLRPEVHTLSVGASRPSDFDVHAEAVELMDRAEDLVAPIEARLRAECRAVLGEEWANHWWEGLPEHDAVPGDVNLLEILRLWGLAKALDLVDFGKMRYNLLGNAGHWFPGQNASRFDEAAIASTLKGYRFADRVPGILREADEMLAGEEVRRLSET